jgi:hypothetical protein
MAKKGGGQQQGSKTPDLKFEKFDVTKDPPLLAPGQWEAKAAALVLDSSDQPPPKGAIVAFFCERIDRKGLYAHATTDEKGRAECSIVLDRAGGYRIWAETEGATSPIVSVTVKSPIVYHTVSDVRVLRAPYRRSSGKCGVRFTVLNRKTNAPLAGVIIQIAGMFNLPETDLDGVTRYEVELLPGERSRHLAFTVLGTNHEHFTIVYAEPIAVRLS